MLTNITQKGCDDVLKNQMGVKEVPIAMDEILKATGADQPCRTEASQYIEAQASALVVSASASVDMGPMSMFGGASVKSMMSDTSSSQGAGKSSLSEGCAQRIIQAAEQINTSRSITCEIQNSSNESETVLNQRASITIAIKPECEHIDDRGHTVDPNASCLSCTDLQLRVSADRKAALEGNMRNASTYVAAGMGELAKYAMDQNKLINEAFPMPFCGIRITNSKIEQSTSARLLTSTKGSLQSNTSLKKAIKEKVKQETQAELVNKLGAVSNGPDTLTLTTTKMESQSEDIATKIINDMNKSTVRATSSGTIEIMSPQGITLDGTVLTNTVEAHLTSESILESAKSMGKTFAKELITDSLSGAVGNTETEKADFAALAKSLGDANALAIEKAMEGHAHGEGSMVAGVIGAIVLLAVVAIGMKVVMGGGGGGGGYDGGGGEGQQYNPDRCEGHESFQEKYGRYAKLVGILSIVLKLQFILFILEQIRGLMLMGAMLHMPWLWGKINPEEYILKVVAALLVLTMFCAFVHNTFNPLVCFQYNFTKVDPGNCYLRDSYEAGGEDY